MSRPSPPLLYRVALTIDVQHVEGGVDRARETWARRSPREYCTTAPGAVYTDSCVISITPGEADYCRKWIPRVFLAHHRADISAAVVLADATTILLAAPAMCAHVSVAMVCSRMRPRRDPDDV